MRARKKSPGLDQNSKETRNKTTGRAESGIHRYSCGVSTVQAPCTRAATMETKVLERAHLIQYKHIHVTAGTTFRSFE